ncbi:uncharacterized protein cnk isoform X2 [Lepeophtheirus salmonis]|uniref:uncharacterized protein cnk isoform X2 n=1 Tax=Lepeophtheirus salmonis TaxID=72036 RepID=UPI001AE6F7DA|nr:connector enhancer of kinase suppressor of ras 3-like isoform X2 [Lepeophtheirus salmonis]
MAYVNVLEWKAESVAEWLRGLDDSIVSYAHFFLNNNVTGKGLLNITVDDLSRLQVNKIGHQELILESIELLKNLHHNLDTENLQYVCLRLSCKARSLCNELRMVFPPPDQGKQSVQTATMLSVGDILDSLLVVLSWLIREPFLYEPLYQEFKNHLRQIGTELATNTQRDTFAEKPIDVILDCCDKLADLSDSLIRDCNDPLILQPASLDVATTRKKKKKKGHLMEEEDEDGIMFDKIYPNFMHVIGRGTLPSVKIEPGDEVIQVNYQTVVGWARKKVLRLMNENPSEVTLTLKKRPRHSTVFGQIYMKPFRIPAREKKNTSYFNNLPSPRAELLVAPQISMTEMKSNVIPTSSLHSVPSRSSSVDDINLSDIDSEDDEAFLPPPPGTSTSNKRSPISGRSPTQSIRSVLLSRPRSAPQRRATISGSSPAQYLNYSNMWNLNRRDGETDTLRSNDSGMSTMSADPTEINRKSPTKHPDRSSYQFPLYTNIPENSRFFDKAVSKESGTNPNMSMDSGHYSDVSSASKEIDKIGLAPKPTPRKQIDSNSSNYKKKPIPQPRTVIRSYISSSSSASSSTSSNSSEDKTCVMIPVPTANFKSYRKFPEQQPSTPSITPVTRLGSVSSSCSSSSMSGARLSSISDPYSSEGKKASPYYVSDIYPRDKVMSRPLPPPPPVHNSVFTTLSSADQHIQNAAPPTFSTFGGPRPAFPLPPIFKPATYTLDEFQKTKQK